MVKLLKDIKAAGRTGPPRPSRCRPCWSPRTRSTRSSRRIPTRPASVAPDAHAGPAASSRRRAADALVAAEDIAKSYGGVQALKGVSLSIMPGEVHGLVGANGAGKSTLIRVLAGLAQPDARPDPLSTVSRRRSRRRIARAELGMNFIHQELAFVPGMSVVQNIMLGLPKASRFGLVDWRAVAREVAPLAARVGITAPLFASVKGLSTAEKWLDQHLPCARPQGAPHRHGRADRLAVGRRGREAVPHRRGSRPLGRRGPLRVASARRGAAPVPSRDRVPGRALGRRASTRPA